MTNPPDSPPAGPVVPRGLATTLGQVGTLLGVLASTLTAVLPGDHSGQTKLFATLATVIAVATILGRMLQATAAILKGSPLPPADQDELPHVAAAPAALVPPDEGDAGAA